MDSFRNLKYIGYCLANRPPEDARETMEDFVNYCKFQLCLVNHKLMKDPIWDDYSEAELLSEYFAHAMVKDKDFSEKFLQQLSGTDTDVYDWLDQQITQNQEDFKQKAMDQDLEEEIEFSPESIGD